MVFQAVLNTLKLSEHRFEVAHFRFGVVIGGDCLMQTGADDGVSSEMTCMILAPLSEGKKYAFMYKMCIFLTSNFFDVYSDEIQAMRYNMFV